MVHEVAAAGFSDAADYEAARPSYPPDAVAWFVEHLRLGPGRRVVDLAAGTGKLTRLLAPTGADLVAVEPVAGMRDDVPRACCPTSRSSRHRRGAAVRDARRSTRSPSRRRGTGSTTTARSPRCARVAAPGRPARARLERARPQRAVGRRGVVDHGPRREAGAVARPRELARQRVPRDARLRRRCTPASSATCNRHARGDGAAGRVGQPRRGAARCRAREPCSTRSATCSPPTPTVRTADELSRSPTGSTAFWSERIVPRLTSCRIEPDDVSAWTGGSDRRSGSPRVDGMRSSARRRSPVPGSRRRRIDLPRRGTTFVREVAGPRGRADPAPAARLGRERWPQLVPGVRAARRALQHDRARPARPRAGACARAGCSGSPTAPTTARRRSSSSTPAR